MNMLRIFQGALDESLARVGRPRRQTVTDRYARVYDLCLRRRGDNSMCGPFVEVYEYAVKLENELEDARRQLREGGAG